MRCPACPVAPDEACHGETGDRPHFCDYAASGEPAKLMLVVDVSRTPAPGKPCPPPPAGPVPRSAKPRIALGVKLPKG